MSGARTRSKPSRGTAVAGVARRMPAIAATLVKARRQDLATLRAAGRLSAAGLDAVVRRHRDILKEALGELRTLARVMRIAGARDSVSQLDEVALGALKLSLSSVRELAALAAATQKEALKLIERRAKQDIEDLKTLPRGKPPARRAK